MFGLGMKSVYIGYSLKDFSEIREVLAQNNIDYKYKVKNRNASWLFPDAGTVRARTGSAGIDPEREHEYEILVKQEKAEEASVLIHRHLSHPAL